MLFHQIKTSPIVTEKIKAAGGEGSVAKRILDGLRWRIAHDTQIGTLVDKKGNVFLLKSKKKTKNDPVVTVLYRVSQENPKPYYDVEFLDINITP